jgi:4-diphosphocytidyl-2-C-methyl-D-erythritol kinase
MNRVEIEAPAKVNLHLKVLEKRDDGFHNIESVFFALPALHDTLVTALCDKTGIAVETCGLPESLAREMFPPRLLPEENLVMKAAALFAAAVREYGEKPAGFAFTLTKRIPPGGGLGGGSSDAAAALLSMNDLMGWPFSREELAILAGRVGSDVPFFLGAILAARKTGRGFAASVAGRGEKITPIVPPLTGSLVLVNAGQISNTARAYALLDKNRPVSIHTLFQSEKQFYNSFTEVLCKEDRTYSEILGALESAGAAKTGVSGSGATCFGLFERAEAAEAARKTLAEKWPWVFVD